MILTICLLFSLVIDLRDENKDYVEYKDLPLRIEMLLILITSMVVAQIILFEWKKRYLKSFQVNCYFYYSINFIYYFFKYFS